MRRLTPVLLFLVAVLFISGCDADSLSGDTIFLNHEFSSDLQGQSIHFSFSGDDLQTNRLQDVSCGCQLSLNDFVESRGFSMDQLVAAQLESAELVILFPIGTRADFMNQAILKFTANGISTTEVASQSSFPASREVPLSVLPNRDIASFLEKASFGAILQLDPSLLDTSQDYDMSIILDIRMEFDDSL